MKDKSASSTAYTVLQGLLHVATSKEHAYLVPQEVAEAGRKIMSASEEGKARLQQIDRPWTRFSVWIRETLLLPGITVHYALRKRYVEDQTRKAIAEGATQVVILGAGFDPLAWRLSKEFANTQFIEIDHPETQKPKTAALLGSTADAAENLRLLSVDFTQQSLLEALEGCAAFHRDRPTIYVCEGVLMYLDRPDIDAVFQAIAQLTGTGSLLLFTAIEPQSSPRNNIRPLLFSYLSLIGEPLKWAASREALEPFLHAHGCDLLDRAGTDELRKLYITTSASTSYTYHYGEHFALCRFR